MIKRINKIKNFGIYKNFKWNDSIQDFNQYNLIYGRNYSGKTTLSRIFRCIELNELHQDFSEGEFELIDINNNKIENVDLLNSPYQFRVFNSDYVADNLQWDDQEAKPIFILGKEDIKLQKRIKILKKEIENLLNEKENKENEKQHMENDMEKKLTNKARDLNNLKSPYNKRKFRKNLEKIQSYPKKYCLDKQEVSDLVKMLIAIPMDKLSEIYLNVLSQDKLIEIKETLKITLISQIIDRLKDNPELNNWVRKGLNLHRGKNKCEFCGSSFPKNLLEKYDKHFSKEYENLINELKGIIQNLEEYKIILIFPDEKRLYPQFEILYKNVKIKLKNLVNKYNRNIEKIIDLINEKINNPFQKFSEKLIRFDVNCFNESLKEINIIIKNHNSICDKFEDEIKNAFEKLERHYACEFNKENNYFYFLKKIQNLEEKINKINKDIDEKETEINKIKLQLSDIARAANIINNYLKSIFGREHLKIETTDKNKFRILRDGKKARNLSEGEKTAVAFSYFLTRLKDNETDISKSIIFIDDPISSLDSNHLFYTYAVIQNELENCNQLFISTHNFEFFTLIKEWLKDIKGHKDKCRYYLNERIMKNNYEISDLRELPSFLLKHNSQYQFLFYKIKSFADNPNKDFEIMDQLPNIIRRFLEALIGFKYARSLKTGLNKLICDDSECIKVNKFINKYSHQQNLLRTVTFHDTSECEKIVNIVLNAIENNDKEHYETLENIYKNTCMQ